MSKLLNLLKQTTSGRLVALPSITERQTDRFNVKNQGIDGDDRGGNPQQSTAARFFSNRYQSGFNVGKSKVSLGTGQVSLPPGTISNITDFTATVTTQVGSVDYSGTSTTQQKRTPSAADISTTNSNYPNALDTYYRYVLDTRRNSHVPLPGTKKTIGGIPASNRVQTHVYSSFDGKSYVDKMGSAVGVRS